MAMSTTSCEAICLCKLLAGLSNQDLDPTVIYCDNKSCIKLYKNPLFHHKSKHIEIIYHFMRNMVQKRVMKLQ
jgi:hypothetical protein